MTKDPNDDDPKQDERERKAKKKKSQKTRAKKRTDDDEHIEADHHGKDSERTYRQQRLERERRIQEEEEELSHDNRNYNGMLDDQPGAYAIEPFGIAPSTPAMLSGTIVVGEGNTDLEDVDDDKQTDLKTSPTSASSNDDGNKTSKKPSADSEEPVLLQAHLVTDTGNTKEEIEEEIKQNAPQAEVVQPKPSGEGLQQEVPLWCCVAGCLGCVCCCQAMEECWEAILGD